MNKAIKYINRLLNRKSIRNKVFCIGLHKTGTTTLAHLFEEYGFRSIHATDWGSSEEKLNHFDFFSDGGSHFDHINEFDYRRLFENYPNAKFILQTRDTEKWVVSKLKHAGWNQNTKIEEDNPDKINHADWRYKSLLTVQKFIEHKFNYERKVLNFFNERAPSRLLVIDITKRATQNEELRKIKDFLSLKSIAPVKLPHSNKVQAEIDIPKKVKTHIKQVVVSLHNIKDKTQGPSNKINLA